MLTIVQAFLEYFHSSRSGEKEIQKKHTAYWQSVGTLISKVLNKTRFAQFREFRNDYSGSILADMFEFLSIQRWEKFLQGLESGLFTENGIQAYLAKTIETMAGKYLRVIQGNKYSNVSNRILRNLEKLVQSQLLKKEGQYFFLNSGITTEDTMSGFRRELLQFFLKNPKKNYTVADLAQYIIQKEGGSQQILFFEDCAEVENGDLSINQGEFQDYGLHEYFLAEKLEAAKKEFTLQQKADETAILVILLLCSKSPEYMRLLNVPFSCIDLMSNCRDNFEKIRQLLSISKGTVSNRICRLRCFLYNSLDMTKSVDKNTENQLGKRINFPPKSGRFLGDFLEFLVKEYCRSENPAFRKIQNAIIKPINTGLFINPNESIVRSGLTCGALA
ncbi:MAG: hypothetical protein HQM08_28795 [Candidatus Riflebacteria bacterium]|nr:hypothetical protein [Candidatus Riflebacteria bacterium]